MKPNQTTDVKILLGIKSEWKAFITIKDVLKAKLDKTRRVYLFNNIVLLVILCTSETQAIIQQEE